MTSKIIAQTKVQLKIRHQPVRVAQAKIQALTFTEAGAAGSFFGYFFSGKKSNILCYLPVAIVLGLSYKQGAHHLSATQANKAFAHMLRVPHHNSHLNF